MLYCLEGDFKDFAAGELDLDLDLYLDLAGV